MATWAKIKFFWDTMLGSTGSSLTATSTASGYSVNSIYNMLETTLWKSAVTTNPQYITLDLGVGNTAAADYLAIIGHNLFTIGASITLQYSTDNFSADINDAFTGFAPASDAALVKEFTAPAAKRYWRLKISGTLSAAPYITVCIWGMKTELDYASASFDPQEQEDQLTVNKSYGGYVAGIHVAHTKRSMRLNFEDCDDTLYGKLNDWYENHGLQNFFVAWKTANSLSDVFLMRREGVRHWPLVNGGAYRDIVLSLTGRKE